MRSGEPPARPTGRRRAIRILAATAGLPLAIGAARLASGRAGFHEWTGEALGAVASVRLWHVDREHARRAIHRVLAEIRRVARVVDLADPESELARLNREGRLERPSADLRHLLETSQHIGTLSGGAFDVSVQPLWTTYHRHFRERPHDGTGPPPAVLEAARKRIDYRRIAVGSRRVELGLPGMALTLNGIAQGHLTDRAADLLRNEGFEHALVDLGEIRVLGARPEGRPWRIGLRAPASGPDGSASTELADAALAVSSGLGTPFEPTGRHHHIFDPATGTSATRLAAVSVVAPRAAIADALATAIFVGGEPLVRPLLAAFPGIRVVLAPHPPADA